MSSSTSHATTAGFWGGEGGGTLFKPTFPKPSQSEKKKKIMRGKKAWNLLTRKWVFNKGRNSKAEQRACLCLTLHSRKTFSDQLCTKLERGPSPIIDKERVLNQGGFHLRKAFSNFLFPSSWPSTLEAIVLGNGPAVKGANSLSTYIEYWVRD